MSSDKVNAFKALVLSGEKITVLMDIATSSDDADMPEMLRFLAIAITDGTYKTNTPTRDRMLIQDAIKGRYFPQD